MAVSNGLHANSTGANVHTPISFTYADQTEREAATVAAGDVGKFAWQQDDDSIYILTDDDPITWVGLGSSTAIHTDESGEINGLTEKVSPANGDMLLIEDSAASYAKKKVQIGNLPGGSGGALVLLEHLTASGSASLDLTSLSDTYNDYLLKISGIIPASSGTDLLIRFATDATPTWDAGNNYRWARNYWSLSAGPGQTGDGGATSSIQIGPLLSTTAGYSFSADIRLSNLRTAALYKSLNSRGELQLSVDSGLYAITTMGWWLNSSVKAFGIRLIMSSGNIASGNVSLYGLADS